MIEHISIFNYEAFYLDYLEGNLDDNDTRLLLEFLESHPELEVENNELPLLNPDVISFKNQADLKEFDNDSVVDETTVEHFILEDTEGIISPLKKEELDLFLKENKKFIALYKDYESVVLIPSLKETFVGIQELKRKRKIVYWPYISTAAAAAIAFLLYFSFPQGSELTLSTPKVITPIDKVQLVQVDIPETPVPLVEVNNSYKAKEITESKEDFVLPPKIETKSTRAILSNNFQKDVQPIALVIPPSNSVYNTVQENTTLAMQEPNSDLSNPIEPITDLITKKTNVEVDFRNRKKSAKKKGGLFVKIGKFEFSRNAH